VKTRVEMVSTPLMRPFLRSSSAPTLIRRIDHVKGVRAGGNRVAQLPHLDGRTHGPESTTPTSGA